MATKFDIKKSLTDATPLYAAVGAADTVYTTVRDRALTAYSDADARVQSLRAELKPSAVQAKLTKRVADVRDQVEAIPATATKRIDEASIEANDQYFAYAKRGEKVVKSLRKQVDGLEATARKQVTDAQKTALKQVTDAQKTARKQVTDAQKTVVSTVAAGRKDAAKVVADAAGKVEAEARTQVRSSAAKEGAAKRPARKTVAKKATAKKAPATKASATKPASTTAAAPKTDA
ncbi:hypothetical protein [Calidifontibacter indicus]|uniref:hypothetical protein n=1 Tax=Calidifontibacter indicus TaxID=419650 RepID=UPI003D74F90A